MDLDFSGKVVLVTGGGAGIGRAIAEEFAAHKAHVVVAEIDPKRCDDVKAALEKAPAGAMVVQADVTKSADVARMMHDVEHRFGGLDVVVNNVGDFLGIAKPFEYNSDEEIEALYAINLKQVFLVTRAAIPLLKKRGAGGSIISVSSIEAFRGIPNVAVYSACKHAITGFTRCLALELGPSGIRVNAIAPETTHTPQVRVLDMIPEKYRDNIPRWIPLGRFGKPEDAAGCALFLASPLSAWVTGTTINLDGGALAAGGWYRDPRGIWTNVPVVSDNGLGF